MPQTEGYWISPGGDIAEVDDHFRAIEDAPEAFGFRPSDAVRWKRSDRDRILREAILRGWIRVRGHRDHTTFEMKELSQDSSFAVKSFLEATSAWPQESIEVHEIGPRRAWRESAAYFLEDRHLALLGQADVSENGLSSDLARVVTDPKYLADQDFVPKGVPRVYALGSASLGAKVVRTTRSVREGRAPLAAAFVMGLTAGYGEPARFDPDQVRDEAMKRFPKGGTLVVQLGWFEGTREDSIRLTLEETGSDLGESGFRKEIETMVRAFLRRFRQRSIWLDYYRGGERLEAISFDFKT